MHSWSGMILSSLSPAPVTPCLLLKSYPHFNTLFSLHLPKEGFSDCLSPTLLLLVIRTTVKVLMNHDGNCIQTSFRSPAFSKQSNE